MNLGQSQAIKQSKLRIDSFDSDKLDSDNYMDLGCSRNQALAKRHRMVVKKGFSALDNKDNSEYFNEDGRRSKK